MNEETAKKLQLNDFNLTYFKFIAGKSKLFINQGKINMKKKIKIWTGSVHYDDLLLNGKPDTLDYLLIKSDAISKYNSFFITNPFAYEKNIDGEYITLIKIKFRKCIQGEVYLKNINA